MKISAYLSRRALSLKHNNIKKITNLQYITNTICSFHTVRFYREATLFSSKFTQKKIPNSIIARMSKCIFRAKNRSQLFFRSGLVNLVARQTLSKKHRSLFNKKIIKINGNLVFEYTPTNLTDTSQTLIYAHGGGLVLEMLSSQLNVLAEIAYKSQHQLVIPMYPLVQHRGGTVKHIQNLMNHIFELYESQGKIISLIGDSAGGNIIMAQTTYRDNNDLSLPKNVIALFPWLNLELDNPTSTEIESKDALLSISGAQISAQIYAGDLEITDPLVSPFYAKYSNNYNLMLTASENDILTPDIEALIQKLNTDGIEFKYHYYKDAYHDFLVFNTTETEHLINTTADFLLNND